MFRKIPSRADAGIESPSREGEPGNFTRGNETMCNRLVTSSFGQRADKSRGCLQRLGQTELDLTRELEAAHEQIAALASAVLPPHASESQISEVVVASGYSKSLITGRDAYVRATSTKPAAANIARVPV